jgi:hypothetical protein
MRQVCSLIAGVAITFALSGCSESPPESGPVGFKATQSPAIDALRKQMSENVAGGKTAKKADATGKPATDTKAADTKATPDTKEGEKP